MTKKVKSVEVEGIKVVTLGDAVEKLNKVSAKENVNLFAEKVVFEWEAQVENSLIKLSTGAREYNQKLKELEQELKQYEKAYDEAYFRIADSSVETVASRNSFVKSYELQLNSALNNVESFKSSIEAFKQQYQRNVDALNTNIDTYRQRIERVKNPSL